MSVAPALDQRDIRSAALPFKRDKDQVQKWSNGVRPGAGARVVFCTDEVNPSSEVQKEKIRPSKQINCSEGKSHANKTPKPYGKYFQGTSSAKIDARQVKKVDAIVDANDHTTSPLSKSLLELLPQHANNTQSAIQTAIRESAAAIDSEILYSFDNTGPSPGQKGRNVDLGGLVEIAEKKWANDQTDRILKGEYEVLDIEGEVTVLSKNKGKKSPKQKAAKVVPVTPKSMEIEDDDGFELI